MQQFSQSWELLKSCFSVLRSDKELLLFPILAGICSMVVVGIFAIPLLWAELFQGGFTAFNVIVGFCFYLCQSMVIFYFNAALVGAAMIRLQGGDPTFSDGIRIANEHAMAILGYAAISATVGVILRSARRKRGVSEMIGKMAGMAWTVATTLVIPIIVTRKIGPIDAIAESTQLLKKTWGENLIGAVGIWAGFKAVGFIYFVLSVGILIACFKVSSALFFSVLVILIIGLLAQIIIKSAISAIYTAVLYRFAAEGTAPQGFENQQLDLAFGAKA